ncbi:unannotated protein [freshwater metagenome]|uniref:Unannotated protein n=1 Tax=freshwater metagenome TaxID=449393 RepID=A0A6J7XUH5_9ZZZZ|nr:hypothetical protein [Actinomycetota bacterium]
MKKFFARVGKLFTDRKIWVRQIVVAGLAAATAWAVGDALVTQGGVVAAIVCSLSIRISLYKSVREGFGQIIGTAIGAGVALFAVYLFNFGFIAVGMTVLLCSVVARGLHLGDVASINVPVTALIVIGPGLSENTAFHRLMSTLIGAAIAIIFSYFSHAKTPAGRTVEQIRILGKKSAVLLAEMSEGVATGYRQDDAGAWLAGARLLVEEIPSLRSQSLEAKRYARWSPLAQVDEADALYLRGVAIEHIVVQVRTIARTLFDLAVDEGVTRQANRVIASALSTTSEAIRSKIELIENQHSESQTDTIAGELRLAGATLAENLISQAGHLAQEQLVRGIAIASNIERIADSLDESSPALMEVTTPDEPAAQKVLKISALNQSKRFLSRIWRGIRIFLRR